MAAIGSGRGVCTPLSLSWPLGNSAAMARAAAAVFASGARASVSAMVQSFLCLKYGVHLPQLQYLLHLLGGPVLFDSDHVSPDGALRFLVRSPDGDITM